MTCYDTEVQAWKEEKIFSTIRNFEIKTSLSVTHRHLKLLTRKKVILGFGLEVNRTVLLLQDTSVVTSKSSSSQSGRCWKDYAKTLIRLH